MKASNTITADNMDNFAELCSCLVRYGVTFTGDACTLTVTLTGGY
jgi:hypothetical protein